MRKMLALVWNDLRPVCSRQDKTRENGDVPENFVPLVALLPSSFTLTSWDDNTNATQRCCWRKKVISA